MKYDTRDFTELSMIKKHFNVLTSEKADPFLV